MKRIWIILIIGLTFSGNFAFAGERLDEMIEAIEATVEDSEEQEVFSEAVEEYIQERDATLTVLAKLIEVATEGNMQGEWENTVDDLSDIPVLSDIGSSLSSDAAIELYDQFMDEEQAWISALSVMNTANYRDEIIALRVRLSTMTQLLETKWQGLLNDDGQLDQKELKVMADISGIFTIMAGNSDTSRKAIRDKLQDVANFASTADLLPGSGDGATIVKDVIIQAITYYNTYKTNLESLKPQLKDLAGQELGLLVIFNDTRKDTQLFVEQNNYDKMKALYAEADKELSTFRGVGTSAQRDDATEFATITLGLLSKHVSEGQKIFDDFVTKHNLKFFGPVGPDIKEALLETQVWLAEADKARNLDLQELLSSWRSDANSFFGVNLSVDGITDEEREFIEDQLRGDIELLKKAIDDDLVIFSNDNLSLIYDRRTLIDTIK